MDFLGKQAGQMKEPIITALIVNKGTGRCSSGLKKEFGIYDDESERKSLYIYWLSQPKSSLRMSWIQMK
jgi:hypothetical protein